jgi:hypothetical protein
MVVKFVKNHYNWMAGQEIDLPESIVPKLVAKGVIADILKEETVVETPFEEEVEKPTRTRKTKVR